MWDERYSIPEYLYGIEPNDFLVEQAESLAGPVLSIGEGEGRNAVYLAGLGLEVLGVDGSAVGLAKAEALAKRKHVSIRTVVADLSDFEPEPGRYGTIVSIFAHLPSTLRQRLYPRLEQALKPGGRLILEAYTPAQLAYDSGGPRDEDWLMNTAKITAEFPNLEPVVLQELERDVMEGNFHYGRSAVVQFVGRKR